MLDLVKIGSVLRAERESRKVTLEDVSKALCLRKSLIGAIEAGNWSLLPHEVYVRSYLKEYAGFLKLPHDIVLQAEIEVEETEQTQTEEVMAPKREPVLKKLMFTRIPRAALLYPAIILLVAGFYMVDRIQRNNVSLPRVEPTGHVSSPTHIPASSPGVSDTSPTNPPSVIQEGKKLLITCHERTWISVVIDEVEKKEFMLNAQEMIILTAKEKFDLLIGNAGGVKLVLDGKESDFSGQSGQVKRIRLS
jgi:transcriptional regulator with XRE-family HTH domain